MAVLFLAFKLAAVAAARPPTKLARVRVREGISQEDLARWSGISRSTIQRLEAGRTENPRVRLLSNLALAMGVALEEILEAEWAGWTVFDASAPGPPTAAQREEAREQREAAPGPNVS